MSNLALYAKLKRLFNGKELQMLYSLLYTTQNSYFESNLHLTNLDWDRHALFLLQNYYEVDIRSFSQLFEEYTLDFFSPPGDLLNKEQFEEYLEILRNNSQGNESGSQLNSREILQRVWEDSFSGSTVQKKVIYPSTGKILLNRLIFIAKHSVKEQTQTSPIGLKRITSKQRTKYFVNRMESISKHWKLILSELEKVKINNDKLNLTVKNSDRQNLLTKLQFSHAIEEYKGESFDQDEIESNLEESSRGKVSFYTTHTQLKVRSFIQDLMKISNVNDLFKTFILRFKEVKNNELLKQFEEVYNEQITFDELEKTLAILLSGEREIPLRYQKDERIIIKRASGSLLKSYLRCPWVFMYKYLFKIKFPDTSASYSGNVLHEAQDKFQRLVKNAEEKGENVDYDNIREIATIDALESMENRAKTAPVTIQKRIKDSKTKLEKDINSVFEKKSAFQTEQQNLLNQGKIKCLPEIITEQEIKVDFEGIQLVGTIDRIEKHFPVDREEYIVICEFKSNLHPRTKPETHHQLMIYAIAYELIYGKMPHQIALESPQVRLDFTVTKSWMDFAKKFIIEAVNNLNSPKIVAKPLKSNCFTCEARSICPSSFHLFFNDLSLDKVKMNSLISKSDNTRSRTISEEIDNITLHDKNINNEIKLREIINDTKQEKILNNSHIHNDNIVDKQNIISLEDITNKNHTNSSQSNSRKSNKHQREKSKKENNLNLLDTPSSFQLRVKESKNNEINKLKIQKENFNLNKKLKDLKENQLEQEVQFEVSKNYQENTIELINNNLPIINHSEQSNKIEKLPTQVEDILYQMEKRVPRPDRLPFSSKQQNVLIMMHEFLNKLEK